MMESPDPLCTAKVKIEIDVAEEPPQAWLTAGNGQDMATRPSSTLAVVAGNSYAPLEDSNPEAVKSSAPIGDREPAFGNTSAPMGDRETAFGNTSAPMKDKETVAGDRTAPMGDQETTPGIGFSPDNDQEKICKKLSETRADVRPFHTMHWESHSQKAGHDSIFRPIAGAGRFMYIDVRQVEGPFACKECEATFAQSQSLEKHMRVHREQSIIRCKQCDAAFINGSLLEAHTRLKHPLPNPEKMPEMQGDAEKMCVSGTPSDSDIKMELLSESDSERGTAVKSTTDAPEVGEVSNLGVGRQISQTLVDNGDFSCEMCHLTFPSAEGLAPHLKLHTEEGNTADIGDFNESPASFQHPSILKKHWSVPTAERPFACELCRAAYRCSSDLESHRLSEGHFVTRHLSSPPRGTQVTETVTGEKSASETERFSGMEPNSLSGTDKIANIIVTNKATTVSGKHTPALGQPFAVLTETTHPHATESPRISSQALVPGAGPDLTTDAGIVVKTEPLHLEVETIVEDKTTRAPSSAERWKYSCTECNLRFKQSGTLNEHMRVHTGERPFPCPHCSFSFKRSTHLTTHILRKHSLAANCTEPGPKEARAKALQFMEAQTTETVNEEKSAAEGGFIIKMEPLSESDAEMESGSQALNKVTEKKDASSSSGVGKRSSKKNRGAKKLSCPECSATFRQPGSLNAHVRVHTGERPFPCPYCVFSFKRSTHLKNHLIRKHPSASDYAAVLHEEARAKERPSLVTQSAEKDVKEKPGITTVFCGFTIKSEPPLETDLDMEVEDVTTEEDTAATDKSLCSSDEAGEQPVSVPELDQHSERSSPLQRSPQPDQHSEGSSPMQYSPPDHHSERLSSMQYNPKPDPHSQRLSSMQCNPKPDELGQRLSSMQYSPKPDQRSAILSSTQCLPQPDQRKERLSNTQSRPQPESGCLKEMQRLQTEEERPFLCPFCAMSFRKLTHLKIHTQRKHPLATKQLVPAAMAVGSGEHLTPHTQPAELPSVHTQAAELPSVRTRAESVTSVEPSYTEYVIKRELFSQRNTETEHAAQNRVTAEGVYSPAAGNDGRKRPDKGDRKLSCPECSATFKQSGSLNEHMRVHTGERPFPCTQCNMSFKRSTHLRTHVLRKHTVLEPEGTSEDGAAKTEVLLSKYAVPQKGQTYRKYTGGKEPTFHCTECEASFLYPCELNQHTRVHTGERPFKCSVCHATFARSGNMKAHMRIHTGVKPFMCSICNETFALASKLKSHTLRKHTPGSLLQFHCADCDASFVYQSELKKHELSHLVDKPYPCSKCKASFSHQAALETHILRKHTTEKMLPYPCTSCVSSFMSLGELKRHSRVHTGEKPFPCSKCDESFAQSGTLKRHMMRKHSAKKS